MTVQRMTSMHRAPSNPENRRSRTRLLDAVRNTKDFSPVVFCLRYRVLFTYSHRLRLQVSSNIWNRREICLVVCFGREFVLHRQPVSLTYFERPFDRRDFVGRRRSFMSSRCFFAAVFRCNHMVFVLSFQIRFACDGLEHFSSTLQRLGIFHFQLQSDGSSL